MLDFSMIQLVRRMEHKFDKNICQELVQFYRPFRSVPCFLHRPLEYVKKKARKIALVIEFEADSLESGIQDVKKTKCRSLSQFPSISCCSTKLSISKVEYLCENCNHIKKLYYDKKVTALLDVASHLSTPII